MQLAGERSLAMPGDRSFTLWRCVMIKTLMAIAVAGAFALPVAALASAGSDNIVVAQASSNPPGTASPGSPRDATTSTDRDASTGTTSNRTGFDRLDKNHDGFISR